MSEQRIGDPVQAVGYQRSLIQATRQLEEQRRALSLAKTELATLINLPLGTELTLATQDEYVIPELKVDLARLEQEALTSRPELREQDYQKIGRAAGRERVCHNVSLSVVAVSLTLNNSHNTYMEEG